MSRYIEREPTIEAVRNWFMEHYPLLFWDGNYRQAHPELVEMMDGVCRALQCAPSADVIPCEDAKRIAKETVAIVTERQHAFWSRYDKYGHYDHYNAHCTNCDYEIGASGWPTDYETPYCPSCGCRMDAPKPDNGLPDR